jgi:UDP-glucuronate decarboxylase
MDTNKDVTGPVNLGNPGEFTMLELAQKVIDLTGSKSELLFGDLPQDDAKQRQPDIELAKRELGWEPTISLDQGLRYTVDYFRNRMKDLSVA